MAATHVLGRDATFQTRSGSLTCTVREGVVVGRPAVIVAARADPTEDYDVLSRVFAPNAGIPKTRSPGPAHCALAACWTPLLGRSQLVGHQVSPRGGRVRMRLQADRVALTGQAVTVAGVELCA